MLAWLLVIVVAVGLPTLLGWVDLAPIWSRPVAADLAVTVLTVVPFLVYLVRTEAGPARATWGKRRSGLVVEATDGPPAGTASIVLRNVIKVLPWQLGHMAAMRFSSGASGADIALAVVFDVASLTLLALVMGPPLLGRRGLHELIAGTAVRAASPALQG